MVRIFQGNLMTWKFYKLDSALSEQTNLSFYFLTLAKLTARERLIKMRKEMRKRYEMIREASEIKRDETFKPYRAQKVREQLSRAKPHPDPVIESIALSSVPVPDVTMRPDLPVQVVDQGKLSDLQLEAVIYSQQVWRNSDAWLQVLSSHRLN